MTPEHGKEAQGQRGMTTAIQRDIFAPRAEIALCDLP